MSEPLADAEDALTAVLEALALLAGVAARATPAQLAAAARTHALTATPAHRAQLAELLSGVDVFLTDLAAELIAPGVPAVEHTQGGDAAL